jgi:hypothetical protein|tara:strand:+ start:281 stop:496 length:216 start_codon:yes stop_codon:yes gene_type:complete
MTIQDIGFYEKPEDVQAVLKVYPVTSKLFSLALIKIRYDKMDKASQIRAERTMLAMSDGRSWDAKSRSETS